VTEVYSLTLQNEVPEIARLTLWLCNLTERLHLTARTAYAIQLCIEEAVTNVVSYAFPPGSAHEIQIALWQEGETFVAEVVDDGKPFDPRLYEVAAAPPDLETSRVGGLGIKLIRSFAERIDYQRADSTNRLRLSFSGA
jgi:anti-sigma regulatory factor (Ser/Thr protein kinase)